MGVSISKIINKNEISIEDLSGKTLCVDSFNMLYQFLTTIRQPDGQPLSDINGVTSHLIGIIYRVSKLLMNDIKLIFVFDGKEYNPLKDEERKSRIEKKTKAYENYKIAEKEDNIKDMKKYLSQTIKVNKEIIDEAKELLTALGCAVVVAKSEGEKLASKMVLNNLCYGVVSQDYDCLLFGASRVIRNLSLNQKRMIRGKKYDVKIEEIILGDVLNDLGIDYPKLIALGILVGTDFNKKGILGIGPKKALKIVKEYNTLDEIFSTVEWDKHYDFSWKEIYNIFNSNEEVPKEINFPKLDTKKVFELLCERHTFDKTRIENVLTKLNKADISQEKLSKWF